MYKEDTLKNGLRIITSNMPNMESVSIGIWIGVGGRYESRKMCGMSHLVEHMLFKGTVERTAKDLKESIEGIGGTFNGFTSEDLTCYLVKLPSFYTELGVDVLTDMVLNPKMDRIELEKEKFVICEEIKMYMDQPSHYVFDILSEGMWPDHALGRPIAGYINSVKGFKREDVILFKEGYYTPQNMAVVAAGKVDRKKILKLAKRIFAARPKKKVLGFEPVGKRNKGKCIKFAHKNTKQTHIAFGFHSVKKDHKLRYALSILNVILGGNMSSRLFEKLREQKALCYDISSSLKKYKDTGAFVIHAGVDNKKFLEASKEVIKELKVITKSNVTPDELKRAKEYSKGQLLLAIEETASRMLWLGDKIMTEGKAPSVKELFKKIEYVKTGDVKEAAQTVFKEKNLNFAVVGPVGEGAKTKFKKILSL